MNGIKIENLQAIERAVKERLDKMEPVFEKAVGAEIQGIKARTRSGIDVNGRKFEGYSENPKWIGKNWKDVRESATPPRQTAYVDLSFDGDMLSAIKAAFKRDGFKFLATIFFNSELQGKKALGHQTGKLGKNKFFPRKFFGLSNSQREAIASKLRNVK